MKYLIHACNQRLWYVNDHLIPSMIAQGIDEFDIDIYLDEKNEGCLESCMKAFRSVPNDDSSTWHMQDDVLICSDFAERTNMHYIDDIVCGYCYTFDNRKNMIGRVKPVDMWYSFPCIRIPNKIAKRCSNWYFNKVKNDNAYGVYVRSKRHDDTLFHIFMETYYSDSSVQNLVPNLVDHVDYLIGGSIVNCMRQEKETHAAYFEDEQSLNFLVDKMLRDIIIKRLKSCKK